MRAGIDTGGYQGLPQTGMTPLVHDEVAVVRYMLRILWCTAPSIHLTVYSCIHYTIHPEIGNLH